MKNKAFTLIELIMTIMVVTVLVIPLTLVVCQYLTSFHVGDNALFAVQLARHQLESVANMDFNNISSAFFSGYHGFPYDVTRNVTYQQGSGATPESLKKIAVEVKPSGGSEMLTEMWTYRAKNVLF